MTVDVYVLLLVQQFVADGWGLYMLDHPIDQYERRTSMVVYFFNVYANTLHGLVAICDAMYCMLRGRPRSRVTWLPDMWMRRRMALPNGHGVTYT